MKRCPFGHALIVCLLFISSFAQSQLQKIYLHPKAAGNEKQSNFVDSIRFIPLDVKEGVELSPYSHVEVTKNYFYFTDYYRNTIKLFSKNGSFVRKINYKKFGSDVYPLYDEYSNRIVFMVYNKNYSLTPKDRIKVILAWNNPRNKKYFKKYFIDLNDTSFTLKKDVPLQIDILHAFPYYEDIYYQGEIITSPLYKDSLDYELKLYKNNQLIKGFFPYNHVNETKFLYSREGIVVNKTETPAVHFISRPYCDTIYKMTGDSLSAAYQLVLPLENNLPASYYTRPFKTKTERENFNRNNGWMFHQVYDFHETPRFVYFMVGYLSNVDSYIYQKQTNTICKIKNIKPDSSQYNLKILGEYGLSGKGARFYETKKAEDLLTFFEKNKNMPVPKELEKFLKSNPPAATPVIIEFKLKN